MPNRVMEEQAPRTSAAVERLTQPMIAATRRSARWTFLAWFVPGFTVGTLITALLVKSGEYTSARAIGIGLTLTAFLIVPSLIVYETKEKGAKFALSLIRNAPAYRVLAFHPQSVNMSRLTVQWQEGEHFEWGVVEVPYDRRLFDGDASVFALRDHGQIGVLLDDVELYMGIRLADRDRVGLPESAPANVAK